MAIQNYTPDAAVLTAAATVQGAAVPALTKRIIRAATVTNTTGATVQFTAYIVPSGGVAGTANALISARSIAPGESYCCNELISQGVNEGGTLQALGNGLTFKHTAIDFI